MSVTPYPAVTSDRLVRARDLIPEIRNTQNTSENDSGTATVTAEVSEDAEKDVSMADGDDTTDIKHKGSFLDCNIYDGSWEYAADRPMYAGPECKWTSKQFICRNGKNSTFEYEKYRWKPSGCDSPPFDRQKYLKILQNKVILIVGDSLAHQQYESLMCTLDPYPDSRVAVRDIGTTFGFFKEDSKKRPNGYAYYFVESNATVVFYWTVTLNKVEPIKSVETDIGSRKAKMAFHVDCVDSIVMELVDRSDVVVLGTGHHWNGEKMKNNRWVLYRNNEPTTFPGVPPRNILRFAREILLNQTAQWMNKIIMSKMEISGIAPLIFFRTMSPRHFVNGDWNSGGTCDFEKMTSARSDPSWVVPTELATKNTKVKVLNVTYLSEFRGEAHLGRWDYFEKRKSANDCLHWCLPGVPDAWNEALYWELLKNEIRNLGKI